MAERANRNIVMMIRSYIDRNHRSWDSHLEQLAFALRTARNDSTQFSPAELFLGRKIITPLDKLFFVKQRGDEFKMKDMDEILRKANINIQKAQQTYSKYYNLRRRPHTFQPGQKILKATHPLSSAPEHYTAKFAPKFAGPYTITEVKGNNLKIENEDEKLTINVDQARPYYERTSATLPKTQTPPNKPQRTSESVEPQPSTSTGGYTTCKGKKNDKSKRPTAETSCTAKAAERPYNKKKFSYARKNIPKSKQKDSMSLAPNASTDTVTEKSQTSINKKYSRKRTPYAHTQREQKFPHRRKVGHKTIPTTGQSILKRPGDNVINSSKKIRFFLKRKAHEIPLSEKRKHKIINPALRDFPEESRYPTRLSYRKRSNGHSSHTAPLPNIPIKRPFTNGNGQIHKKCKSNKKREFSEVWPEDNTARNKVQRLRNIYYHYNNPTTHVSRQNGHEGMRFKPSRDKKRQTDQMPDDSYLHY